MSLPVETPLRPAHFELVAPEWDVVVIGAGPAGALAAQQLARRGVATLLVDKQGFPRFKVCGGCLNRASLGALTAAGLGSLPLQLGAQRISTVRIVTPGRGAEVAIPAGLAIRREALDMALVEAAQAAGAVFLPGAAATISRECSDNREVRLESPAGVQIARAKVVIAADGLAAGSLRELPEFRCTVSPSARIGAGTIVDGELPAAYARDGITMAVGASGYCGVVRVDGGKIEIAAALDVPIVKALGLAAAACRILEDAGLPVLPGMRAARWRGTPPLSRIRRPLASRRVFLLGDAAGYVEPFTGEGMAWALRGAVALAPLAARAARCWDAALADEWRRTYLGLIGARQASCRGLAWGLRQPALVRAGIWAIRALPWLAARYVRGINADAAPA